MSKEKSGFKLKYKQDKAVGFLSIRDSFWFTYFLLVHIL